jgi:DNA-binding response OmpR family regulator
MKILIADDIPELKCKSIIKECNTRGISVEITKSINNTLYYVLCHGEDINGIILDMGLPWNEDEIQIEEKGGDSVLRELKRKKYNIPVLIFSDTVSELKDSCNFVFAQMTDWDVVEEEEKFYKFLEKIK